MGRNRYKPRLNPFCWYCNREFLNENGLIFHQKARHFKCPTCHKRLGGVSGMVTHCAQVHKESLRKVPHACPWRDGVDQPDVFGMTGVSQESIQQRMQEKKIKQLKYFRTDKGKEAMRAGRLELHQRSQQQQQQPPPGGAAFGQMPMPAIGPGGGAPPFGMPASGNMAQPLPGAQFRQGPAAGKLPAQQPQVMIAPSGGPGGAVPSTMPAAMNAGATQGAAPTVLAGGTLVYGDEQLSMEERRAQDPKYGSG